MDHPVRSFLALEIPQHVKDELAACREPLKAELPRARWVRPEGQHLTLKFMGDVPREILDRLVTDLTPALHRVPSVSVQLKGAGFFPSPRRPRVAWIGGQADGAGQVAEVVEDVAAGHGFDRERRRFRVHLTQARLNRPWPPDAVDRFLEWGKALQVRSFVASEVVLFASDLQPTGAVYTALERMPLA